MNIEYDIATDKNITEIIHLGEMLQNESLVVEPNLIFNILSNRALQK